MVAHDEVPDLQATESHTLLDDSISEHRMKSSRRLSRASLLKSAAGVTMGAAAAVIAADMPDIAAAAPAGGQRLFAFSPTTTYQSFMGNDFNPANSASGYSIGANPGIIQQAAGTPDIFLARLDLPQGAQVTDLHFTVLYNDSNGMTVAVESIDSAGTQTVLDFGSPSTASVGTQTVPVAISPLFSVDNSTLSYQLTWSPGTVGPTQQLNSARIGYLSIAGLQIFPTGVRVFAQPMTAGQVVTNIDATMAKSGGASGVPAGAQAAYCAVQSYQPGSLTLYPNSGSPPSIANWTNNGTAGIL